MPSACRSARKKSLRSFKPEALRRFYRDWYRPDLMAVVAVGDIDPAEAEKLVKRAFRQAEEPGHGASARLRPDPAAHGPRRWSSPTRKPATASVLIRYPVQPVASAPPSAATASSWSKACSAACWASACGTVAAARAALHGGQQRLGRLTPRYRSYNASAALGEKGATKAIDALVQENERARRFGFGRPNSNAPRRT
jgi:zinc protease